MLSGEHRNVVCGKYRNVLSVASIEILLSVASIDIFFILQQVYKSCVVCGKKRLLLLANIESCVVCGEHRNLLVASIEILCLQQL